MNKEFLKAIVEMFILLADDEDMATTGIFSDKTIEKMNEVKAKIIEELAKLS